MTCSSPKASRHGRNKSSAAARKLWNEKGCSTLDLASRTQRRASETTVSETSDRTSDESPAANVRKRLQQTIDFLCEDAARVEFWACALSGFAQPVPDFDSRGKYRLESKSNQG